MHLGRQERTPKISAKGWHRSMNSRSMFIEERCKKIEQESVRTDRKWQSVHEQLQKIPELERELRASNQKSQIWSGK